jgi:hypothetical protein
MRNLFIIILLVPITMFGQVKKEVAHAENPEQLNLNQLNSQFKREQAGLRVQLLGFGLMSVGLLSNFSLSINPIITEGKSIDEINADINTRQNKSQRNEFISGLGALISCVGIVIPMRSFQREKFYEIDLLTKSLYASDGDITYSKLISVFKSGDAINVKTMNGEVYKAIISSIEDKKLYLHDDNENKFFFYFNFITSIERQSID